MMQRKIHLDLLRVLSILAVIILHAAGRCIRYSSPQEIDWQICQSAISIFSWAVPIFVMISGALQLAPDKDVTLSKLFGKSILRLAIAYLFWSFVYTIIFSTLPHYEFFSVSGIWNTLTGTLKGGSAHLWFMWMILGLYIMIPIIRACLKNISDQILSYWLILGFIFNCIVPLVLKWKSTNNIFGENAGYLQDSMYGSYIFYFILGYAIEHKAHLFHKRKLIYVIGGLSAIATVGFTLVLSLNSGMSVDYLLDNHSPTMAFMSIALMVGIKQSEIGQTRFSTILVKLSAYAFGVYLVHNLILDSIGIWIIEHTLESIPLSVTMVFLILLTWIGSLLLVWLLRLVKPIAKYIT